MNTDVARPLAEVVFEFGWVLTPSQTEGAPPRDPDYKLLVGSLFDRLRVDYPVHEELPSAAVPDEFVPHIVQHRFRRAPGGYPLVQVGPGIFAANDSAGYSWTSFKPRLLQGIEALRAAHPATMTPESAALKYVNFVPFDFSVEDAFTLLRERFGVAVTYPAELFDGGLAEPQPGAVLVQSAHRTRTPAGVITIRFSSGEVFGQPALVWETQVQSGGEDVPSLEGLGRWLDEAHQVARRWFFILDRTQFDPSTDM